LRVASSSGVTPPMLGQVAVGRAYGFVLSALVLVDWVVVVVG
jgi:hypothetical protein